MKANLTVADHSDYVGSYESDELEARYQIVSEDGKLILRHRKYPDVDLNVITRNQFSTPHSWMENLLFNRDERGRINGFEINSGRVLHLKFRKM
ncbi:MAG: hypothetical protein WD824_03260 [Cyclobacteriaceae bacterium]